jgi:YidC/Oxa1 family membrane protein insertase
MMELYNTLLYQPLFNAVIFLYNILPGSDFGLAIIVLTVTIRIIFFPLTVKTTLSQRAISKINPKIKEIKEKFKNDSQAQSVAVMKLYKDNNVNPLSGCLPLLIQLPILIALYSAFGSGFKPENLEFVYNFITRPEHINAMSFGFLDITVKNHILVFFTGGLQYLQLSQNQALMKGSGDAGPQQEVQALSKQMLYFFPVMIIIIGWNLPAGLLLYWMTTTLFSIGEQAYIKKRYRE